MIQLALTLSLLVGAYSCDDVEPAPIPHACCMNPIDNTFSQGEEDQVYSVDEKGGTCRFVTEDVGHNFGLMISEFKVNSVNVHYTFDGAGQPFSEVDNSYAHLLITPGLNNGPDTLTMTIKPNSEHYSRSFIVSLWLDYKLFPEGGYHMRGFRVNQAAKQ